MARQLAMHVYVDGVLFSPGDDIPDDIAAKITNPKAWGDTASGDDEDDEDDGRPAGNASTEAWRLYAASLEVDVPEEATRDAIIDLVDNR